MRGPSAPARRPRGLTDCPASAHPSWRGRVLAVAGGGGHVRRSFPIGPVRAVYPDRGVNSDWTVLGLGFVVLVGVLGIGREPLVPRSTAPGRRVARGGVRSFVLHGARRPVAGCPRPRSRARPSPSTPARGRHRPTRGGPRCRHHHGRRDQHADLRHEPARVGVPAGPLRMELGLRRADLQRLRAGPGQGRRYAPSRWGGDSVLGNLVRHHAVGRHGGATLLSNPGAPVAPPIIAGHGLTSSARSCSAQRPWRSCTSAIGDTVDLKYVPGVPTPPHQFDHRRRGHHAGHRDRRGAAHLHGDRRAVPPTPAL